MDELSRYVRVDYLDGDIGLVARIYHLPEFVLAKIDAVQVLICIRGTVQVNLNTGAYTLHADDVLFCGPNVLADKVIGSDDMECWGIFLSTRMAKRFLGPDNDLREKFFYLTKHPVVHIRAGEVSVFERYHELLLLRMSAADNPYRKEIMSALTYSVFYDLLANLDTTSVPAEKARVRQRDLLFKRFIELILGHKVKVRSVSYYADKLFVSTKYLSSVCKQVCGKTAFELINELVMADITELLKYSEMSIKEIADYQDFSNLSFFGKYVKSHTGLSPKEYRMRLTGSN